MSRKLVGPLICLAQPVQIMFYLKCEDDPISVDPLDRHLVAVNASPLERDHSLIIPAVNKCLPQVRMRLRRRKKINTPT